MDDAASNRAAVELLGMAKNRLNQFYNPAVYKESGSSSGIINMIDEMGKDMEDEMAEAKRDEEEAQKDYEETMNDAATKRTDDSKLMVTKEGEKAEKTTKLEELKETKRTKKGQLEVLEDK